MALEKPGKLLIFFRLCGHPALAGSILYCLVNRGMCERLANDRYMAVEWPGFESATFLVQHPTYHATELSHRTVSSPHIFISLV